MVEEQDWRVLGCLADMKTAASAQIASILHVSLASVNESYKVLYAAGYLQFADRSGFMSGANEFILARVTEQGILAAHRPHEAAIPPTGSETTAPANVKAPTSGTEGIEAIPVEKSLGATIERVLRLLDEKTDLSEYERGDLRQKIRDFQDAASGGSREKAQAIRGWFTKYAPWIASELPSFDA